MTTATLDQTATDDLTAHEFAPPCDHPTEPHCERSAAWVLLNACCGKPSLRCDEHKAASLTLHESAGFILHVACGKQWPHGTEAGTRYLRIDAL